MAILSELDKEPVFLPNLRLNHPLKERTVKGDVGLELEIEGASLYSGSRLQSYVGSETGATWVTHNDGSLRGGIEYVLTEPCNKTELKPLLDHLFDTLQKAGSNIRHSNRTSTHVHINVQGMKPHQATAFICLWGLFEAAAIEWCGLQRKANQFCLSSSDTSGWLVDQWQNALESGSFFWTDDVRYSALNLAAFSNFGSFEFRCMAGASNADDVVDWAEFLLALRDTAMTMYPDEVGFSTSEMGPTGLLRSIGDAHSLRIVDRLLDACGPRFDSICLDNYRNYQQLSFFVPWLDMRDQIEKRYIKNPFSRESVNPVRTPRVRIRTPLETALAEETARLSEAILNARTSS